MSVVLRLYPALGHPAYRLLWLGTLPSTLSIMMNQVAGPYAAFTLSGSAAVLGLVSLAQGLPMLLLGLVGGVAADRLPRRSVLVGSQLVLGAAAAYLAVLAFMNSLQVWHVVAASFLQGAAFAFNMPSRQAYIAELVPRNLLANAVALNNAGQNLSRVAGPALAGVLLAIPGLGLVATFVTIASMYAFALVSLMRLPGRARAPSISGGGGLSQMAEGLRYARSSPTILTLIAMNLVIVVLAMPYQTLMPVFAGRIFETGASGLGLLMAASGVGALAGAVTVAGLSRFQRPAALQLGLCMALGIALIAFAVTRWFPLAVAILVVVGFLFSAFGALNNTLLMANTEARLTGRVMSIYLLTWALTPAGAVPLAWLAEHAGAPVAIGLAGGLVIAIVSGLAVLHPPTHRIGWSAEPSVTFKEQRRLTIAG